MYNVNDMETIIIKRKEFEILEKLGERSYKLTRKGKTYFAKSFEPKSDEYNDYLYSATRLKSSLVLSPRIYLADKKTGYVVSDYIEGQTVLDYLVNNEPSDDDLIYRQIFVATHLARVNGMVLDCKPDSWVIKNNDLYYMAHYFGFYSKASDFTQTDIRLWFITKELVAYAKEKGFEINKSRLKDEFLTNKHIVLVTCKYYQ